MSKTLSKEASITKGISSKHRRLRMTISILVFHFRNMFPAWFFDIYMKYVFSLDGNQHIILVRSLHPVHKESAYWEVSCLSVHGFQVQCGNHPLETDYILYGNSTWREIVRIFLKFVTNHYNFNLSEAQVKFYLISKNGKVDPWHKMWM